MMIDEQSRHEEFEDACGGPDRAFRLMRIWEDCANPVGGTFPLSPSEKAKKRLEIFARRANGERYTAKQISLFLNLQGH